MLREAHRGAIFVGLGEGPITFLPTYKFEKGGDLCRGGRGEGSCCLIAAPRIAHACTPSARGGFRASDPTAVRPHSRQSKAQQSKQAGAQRNGNPQTPPPPGRESSERQPFYDQGEKRRVPAWTDRVLFRGSAPQGSPLAPPEGGDPEDVRVGASAAGAWFGRPGPCVSPSLLLLVLVPGRAGA